MEPLIVSQVGWTETCPVLEAWGMYLEEIWVNLLISLLQAITCFSRNHYLHFWLLLGAGGSSKIFYRRNTFTYHLSKVLLDSSCKVKKSSLGPARTTWRRFFWGEGTSKNLHPKEASIFSGGPIYLDHNFIIKTKANKKSTGQPAWSKWLLSYFCPKSTMKHKEYMKRFEDDDFWVTHVRIPPLQPWSWAIRIASRRYFQEQWTARYTARRWCYIFGCENVWIIPFILLYMCIV